MGYRIINGVSYPANNFPINDGKQADDKKALESLQGRNFNDILKENINKNDSFTLSNHASQRMDDINFNKADMSKINEAINKADEKGAKNCLIVYKDVALVTSIKNRTVITAVNGSRAKDNVFTNIDSVILI